MLVTQAFRDMKDKIKNIIQKNLPDAECKFVGDSCNLKLQVSSKAFSSMSLIEQHKTIMKLLDSEFKSGDLHALSLETRIL